MRTAGLGGSAEVCTDRVDWVAERRQGDRETLEAWGVLGVDPHVELRTAYKSRSAGLV